MDQYNQGIKHLIDKLEHSDAILPDAIKNKGYAIKEDIAKVFHDAAALYKEKSC